MEHKSLFPCYTFIWKCCLEWGTWKRLDGAEPADSAPRRWVYLKPPCRNHVVFSCDGGGGWRSDGPLPHADPRALAVVQPQLLLCSPFVALTPPALAYSQSAFTVTLVVASMNAPNDKVERPKQKDEDTLVHWILFVQLLFLMLPWFWGSNFLGCQKNRKTKWWMNAVSTSGVQPEALESPPPSIVAQ